MTTATKPVSFGRRFVRWFLISAGICIAPLVVLAAVAATCLMPDRDVSVLRKHVMAATGEGWNTKVQLSVGRGLLGTVGAGLHFVNADGVDEARLALKAVHRASVGVYERDSQAVEWSRSALFKKTDAAMAKHGWARMVGVADGNDTVLLYTQAEAAYGDDIDLCIAVVNGRELVVVSTSVDAGTLAKFAEMHTPAEFKKHVRFAGLKL